MAPDRNFSDDKCGVLLVYLQKTKQIHKYKIKNNWLGNSIAEDKPGIIIDPGSMGQFDNFIRKKTLLF